MLILAIETSCDETAVSVVEGWGGLRHPGFRVLAHIVSSQVKLHARWGGVVPSLAKREHGKNLIPVLKRALGSAKLIKLKGSIKATPWGAKGVALGSIKKILEREPELLKQFLEFIPTIVGPKIDAIAVTSGPGLEPALWVGINFARALSYVWDIPVIPCNHMEGHVLTAMIRKENNLYKILDKETK